MKILNYLKCTNPSTSLRQVVKRVILKAFQQPERDVLLVNDTEKSLPYVKPVTSSKIVQIAEAQEKVRGVNFDVLDKEKTYIGMQYGERTKIGGQIVKYTKKYCPKTRVPAHVFAMSYKNGEWWVYESHIIEKEEIGLKKGSHKLRAKDWINLGKNSLAETDIYEAKLNTEVLDKNAGQPYSMGDAFKHAFVSVFNENGKQSNCEGLICSEYIAMGMRYICDFYHLRPWCITPAHFKDYMVRNGAKQVNV